MKKINSIIISALLVTCLSVTSCLKSYQEKFDNSSAERMTEFLETIQKMLSESEYGWRMEYFYGNEDGDHGGINMALEFADPVENPDGTVTYPDDVTIYFEEEETTSYKSRYVLRRDSGPVLSFDTFSPIMHKYGTASSEYYEGQGGDYEFFIVSNPATEKDRIVLKGKRSGKLCYLYPLKESAASYNAKMYKINKNFYISSFEGYIGDKYVTGEVDVTNHQFTANEMEVYKYEEGKPVYDIVNSVTQPYILTPEGIRFYETLEVFDTKFDDFDFNFDMSQTDTTLVAKDKGVKFKAYIPWDWLPYSHFEGDWTLTYSTSSRINISLIPEVPGQSYRVKGISSQFDLICAYDIKKGRLNLLAQAVRKPDTDEIIWSDETERYYVRMCAWENGGYLTFSTSVGMQASLKPIKDLVTNEIDREASIAQNVFNWTDNGGSKSIHTNSFILYLYDTDDAAESVYGGSANKFSFTGTNYQLPNLKTLTRR